MFPTTYREYQWWLQTWSEIQIPEKEENIFHLLHCGFLPFRAIDIVGKRHSYYNPNADNPNLGLIYHLGIALRIASGETEEEDENEISRIIWEYLRESSKHHYY